MRSGYHKPIVQAVGQTCTRFFDQLHPDDVLSEHYHTEQDRDVEDENSPIKGERRVHPLISSIASYITNGAIVLHAGTVRPRSQPILVRRSREETRIFGNGDLPASHPSVSRRPTDRTRATFVRLGWSLLRCSSLLYMYQSTNRRLSDFRP